MKKIIVNFISLLLLCSIALNIVACTNYEKYAGIYYSSQAEKGAYSNCPRKFYFDDDGSGIYYWKTSTVYFDYKISRDGVVEIKDSIGLFNYTGKFTESQFILDGDYSGGRDLKYNKD